MSDDPKPPPGPDVDGPKAPAEPPPPYDPQLDLIGDMERSDKRGPRTTKSS